MPALTSSRRIGFIAAVLLAATITPAAALAAAAIGHASVTILPSAAAVRETAPIELDSVGNRISTRPGIITLTAAPNLAVAISITGNDTTSPPVSRRSLWPSPTMGARADVERQRSAHAGDRDHREERRGAAARRLFGQSYTVIVNY